MGRDDFLLRHRLPSISFALDLARADGTQQTPFFTSLAFHCHSVLCPYHSAAIQLLILKTSSHSYFRFIAELANFTLTQAEFTYTTFTHSVMAATMAGTLFDGNLVATHDEKHKTKAAWDFLRIAITIMLTALHCLHVTLLIDDVCPVCQTDRYLNPHMRLLVGPCFHKMYGTPT